MDASDTSPRTRGFLARMATHPVAANLLMFVLLVGGVSKVFQTKQEVFPEFSLDTVTVTVPYPGSSPSDVEQGIVLAIEEAVRGVDGVKRVTSNSGEGQGSVTVELLLDANREQVLADVKNEVDRIQTFPEEAEEPIVALSRRRQRVVSLIIAGDQPLRSLHDVAERTRNRLLQDERLTQVEVESVPPLEISIEIPRETLDQYGLTLQEVSRQVSLASLELPGGELETRNGDILVRVADRKLAGHQLEDIVLRSTASGGEVRLGDIATIVDGYEDTDQASFFNGQRAVRLTAYRVGDETPIDVAAAVRETAKQLKRELPPGVAVAVWNDDSEILEQRIALLVKNAWQGLLLVVVILALFLDLRLAFWVSLGIPVSFLGSFLVLGAWDLSINMITLFAFIVTLGMVVDDAIVVGERTYAMMDEGKSRKEAAIEAAKEMLVPVTFAILTTVAAFSPLFFVPGTMGKIFRLIPAVVISVLALSLLESFLILPAHLAHGKTRRIPRKGLIGALSRAHAGFGQGLEMFTQKIYRPVVTFLIRQRYATVGAGLALLILTLGQVASGRVPFNFFPQLEGELVTVQARLPYGTNIEKTEQIRTALESAAEQTIEELGGHEDVRGRFTHLGQSAPNRGPGPGGQDVGSHLVALEIQLVPTDEREFSAQDFAAAWEANTPALVGLESISFNASSGPGAGAAVAVQLSHPDTEILAEVSRSVDETLRTYPDLRNISNEYTNGKTRFDFHLLPRARALGLTGNELALQLRGAFFGAEAVRDQRDRNEIKFMARLPEDERRSEYDLERFMIRTPGGGSVPLHYVAGYERNVSPTAIRREDGRRVVTVEAELAVGVESPREVIGDLQENVFPDLRERYPGLDIEMVGAQREQAETFQSLGLNFVLALFVIFALLAIPFRSYAQPLIIMAVIPFGFVGAVWGHALMGYGLSIMSGFGIVALSGVVVNDSLVLVDATNRERRRGKSSFEAIVDGGVMRLRPILLTSLTTFFGLVPMISETSIQAQFLIPMAISLGFGVLFVTFVVLLLVPALYLIVEDFRSLFGIVESPDDAEDTSR